MINTCDILLDWLTFSGTFYNVDECLEFLGLSHFLDSFVSCPGRWFYKYGFTYQNEITIYMGNNDNPFACCVNISGRGCRDIESFSSLHSVENLLGKIYSRKSEGFKVSRCDLAFDIIDNNFSIEQLILDTRLGNYTCRSKFYNIMESQDDGLKGYSIYFGKKASNIFINIYDKRAERGYSPDDMENWTRIEVRLRHEDAVGFVKEFCAGEQYINNLGGLFFGILNNYLRFLEPDENDTNKARWDTAEYWQQILYHSEAVKVFYSPGIEYDYSKFEEHFFKQYGSSIVTYLKLHSLYDLKFGLESRGIHPNEKQQFLIDNYKDGEYYKVI